MHKQKAAVPYLRRLNPVIKLAAVVVVTVLVSITSAPALCLALIAAAFLLTALGGGIPPLALLRRMGVFLGVSLSFVLFLLVVRGLEPAGDEVRFLAFGYTRAVLRNILALGLRILCIALATLSFVLTTDPGDLVLSLILQLHVPYLHGYAALAAYRFLPAMQDEVKGIRLAQEIRGIEWNKGFINRMASPFRVMLPMLALAARKGERIALAMDSRGLGAAKTRTFYKRTAVTRRDVLFLLFVALFCAAAMLLLSRLNLLPYGQALGAGAI